MTPPRYTAETAALRERFLSDRDGANCVAAQTALADTLVRKSWAAQFPAASGIALLAVGGYGRSQLFPASDIDLLILVADEVAERKNHDAIRRFTQALWDCGMRVSATTRTPEECARLNPENSEFTFALLDARALAGDDALLARFTNRTLPDLLARERVALLRRLVELSRVRHEKYGATIFHLEPNVKETPGTLRDLHVCGWLARLLPQDGSPVTLGDDIADAARFFTAVRCFLHFRADRDDNALYWAAQDEAAAAGIGVLSAVDAASWMRTCFRHARSVQRITTSLLNDAAAESSSIYQQLRRWRSHPRSEDYRVRGAQIVPTGTLSAAEPLRVLRLFLGVAQTGLPLSRATEAQIAELLPELSDSPAELPLWEEFRELLRMPHASAALRAMHSAGVLELLIPEFHGIDALVVRDAWHRFTVDEHTFVLLDALDALRHSRPEQNETSFAALAREVEQPELLSFAALMHDTGKGRRSDDHAATSAELAESVLARWEAPAETRATVVRLIRTHLVMSQALRRDIFDSGTVRAVAVAADTPELLRMLTLLTWADIQAVHPDALTPFKAGNLWQLYIATANYLDRSLDEERIANEPEDAARVTAVLTANRELGIELVRFLEGLPRRYLHTHSRAAIGEHCRMAQRISAHAPIQVRTEKNSNGFETSVITTDRAHLFANIAGALAAQGMNILKAEAFSNAAGVVVDTFRFADTYGTLEQNPEEMETFERKLIAALDGTVPPSAQIESRRQARRKRGRKRTIATQISFDDTSSSVSTVMQVIAADMPGLLFSLSRVIADHGCNIGAALIDTEGEQAIDVFYLTADGARLSSEQERVLADALRAALDTP